MSETMLDTVIVGGGLCGLALARSLHAQGRTFALYEARGRLGGRILSVPGESAGMALDLGPTWFWPDTQPRMTRLAADLGLQSFPQHDDGTVLRLTDHDKKPDALQMADLHGAPGVWKTAWLPWWTRWPAACRPPRSTWNRNWWRCATRVRMSNCCSVPAR